MDQHRAVGIAGRTEQAHGEVFDVISPHTEESIAEVTAATPADAGLAVGAAHAALPTSMTNAVRRWPKPSAWRHRDYDRASRTP